MKARIRKCNSDDRQTMPLQYQMLGFFWLIAWPHGTVCAHPTFDDAIKCYHRTIQNDAPLSAFESPVIQ
jgi:hypothetical protein